MLNSFYQTISTDPGTLYSMEMSMLKKIGLLQYYRVEYIYWINKYLLELNSNNKVLKTTMDHFDDHTLLNTENLCEKCDEIKPQNFHHCSTCNICILELDHHVSFYYYYQ